jgi:hypothetical protein
MYLCIVKREAAKRMDGEKKEKKKSRKVLRSESFSVPLNYRSHKKTNIMKFNSKLMSTVNKLVSRGIARSEATKLAISAFNPEAEKAKELLKNGKTIRLKFQKTDGTITERFATSVAKVIELGIYTPAILDEKEAKREKNKRTTKFPEFYIKFWDPMAEEHGDVRIAKTEYVISCEEI